MYNQECIFLTFRETHQPTIFCGDAEPVSAMMRKVARETSRPYVEYAFDIDAPSIESVMDFAYSQQAFLLVTNAENADGAFIAQLERRFGADDPKHAFVTFAANVPAHQWKHPFANLASTKMAQVDVAEFFAGPYAPAHTVPAGLQPQVG